MHNDPLANPLGNTETKWKGFVLGFLKMRVLHKSYHMVDGTNPAPVGMVSIPFFHVFLHLRWCRISSINNMAGKPEINLLHKTATIHFILEVSKILLRMKQDP